MSDGCLNRKASVTKEAEGATIYLVEELSDARVNLAKLKSYVEESLSLIEKSGHKEEFYEMAAHLLHGIPDTLFKLEKALGASAMAAARIDYEEIKQTLKPEKADELEAVLPDVRMRYLDRRGDNVNPKEATERLYKIAQDLKANPNKALLKENLRRFLACMEDQPATATEEPVAKFEEGKPADPTENLSPEDAAKWKAEHAKNKDKFKTAIEFSTERALKNYLHEHPGADPSKHTVKKTKPGYHPPIDNSDGDKTHEFEAKHQEATDTLDKFKKKHPKIDTRDWKDQLDNAKTDKQVDKVIKEMWEEDAGNSHFHGKTPGFKAAAAKNWKKTASSEGH